MPVCCCIYHSSKTISVILDAKPIAQLSEATTGVVRLEGLAASGNEVTVPGTLRRIYALVQKELFNWTCSKGCDYKLNQDANLEVSGSISVNDIEVQRWQEDSGGKRKASKLQSRYD